MIRRNRAIPSLLCAALLCACAPDGSGGDTKQATSATSSTTGDLSGSVTSAPGSASEGSGGSGSGGSDPTTTADPTFATSIGENCGIVGCADLPGEQGVCDLWAQNCPVGQKCVPVPDADATLCVEVIGGDQPGESCTMENVGSGVDSCIAGAVCIQVKDGVGYCAALCTGDPKSPVCENGVTCSVTSDSDLAVCIPPCDPLLQDCPNPGLACYPANDGFGCAPDLSGDGGQAGDPCEFINTCDPGLLCLDAAVVGAGCPDGSFGCCTPYCKFPGGACPNPDQQCLQYFDPKQLPPGDPKLEIGACGVPG